MTGLKLPALDPAAVEGKTGTIYPDAFKPVIGGRVKRRLSPALGLSDFGVNVVELPSGAASALRHHHSAEDEFILVLSGELILCSDAGEQTLKAGECAGFPKNSGDGHCLVNRSDTTATYLEVGSRCEADRVEYPDVDMVYEGGRFRHKDGRLY